MVVGYILASTLYATALLVAGLVSVLAARPLEDRTGRAADSEQLSLLCTSLGWGFAVIPATAFFLYTATGIAVSATTVLAMALASSLIAGLLWRVRKRAWPQALLLPAAFLPALRRHRGGLVLAVAVAVYYFFHYDRSIFSVNHSCIHQVGLIAIDFLPSSADVMRENLQDARLGNPAVIAGFLAVFQGLGTRLLYAGCGGLMALAAYASSMGAHNRPWHRVLAMALLTLNPYILKSPLVDENLLALTVTASFLPWMLRDRAPWFILGVIASLALGMRHVLVLTLPAIAWVLWPRAGAAGIAIGRRTWRPMFVFFGAVLLGSVPYHLHHHLAMGSVLRFESFGQIPAFAHDFGFGPVAWEGLLNWPFHDSVVRTPHNPFPTFVLWPLWFLDHFGVLLCSAGLIGAVVSLRRVPRQGAFHLLYFGLVAGALAIQEKWDDPNKMGVILVVLWPVIHSMVNGLRAVAIRPTRSLSGLALLVVLILFAIPRLSAWNVPADARYRATFPLDGVEVPDLLEQQRAMVLDVGVLPDYGRLEEFSNTPALDKLASAIDDILHPALRHERTPLGSRPSAEPTDNGASTVLLNLNVAPWRQEAPLMNTSQPAQVDLIRGERPQLVGPLKVAWSSAPVTLLLVPAAAGRAGILLLHGDYSWLADDPATPRQNTLSRDKVLGEAQWLLLGGTMALPGKGVWRKIERRSLETSSIRLQLPAGSLNLAFSYNIEGTRHLLWRASVAAGSVHVGKPQKAWHN